MSPVIEATNDHLEELSDLFDLYRQFYRQQTDIVGAKKFLSERMQKKDSVIYISSGEKGRLSGFVQLYPLFSSVGMKRLWLLNDLFVKEEFRKKGIARKLINHCKKLAMETNSGGLLLETGKNNLEGNVLYPTEGFKLVDESNFYFWKNENK
jgi:GNAT superfamily N-acetyltransferase